jgi:hypothetical protein
LLSPSSLVTPFLLSSTDFVEGLNPNPSAAIFPNANLYLPLSILAGWRDTNSLIALLLVNFINGLIPTSLASTSQPSLND